LGSPAVTALSQDDVAGIHKALSRYQGAYRERDIDALVQIYPNLPRERRQKLAESFQRDCRQYDVTLGNYNLTISPKDPTLATVMTRSVYTCFPGTGQDPRESSVDEMFELRKLGDGWIINNTGTMDMGRRD
jgi:hypothetical protein